ncbi:MAG: hypothetical protein ACXABO_19975 [Promethearchaeota archaeon]
MKIGIIGNKEYNTEIFLNNIKGIAIEFRTLEDFTEIFIVYKVIPIKLKIYLAESLEGLIYDIDSIEKLDAIILTVNLLDKKSIHQYFKNIIEEFNETYYFQGVSVLAGIDFEQVFEKKSSKNLKISRFTLEDTAKYLNLIYCFEIINKTNDVVKVYKKICDDFLFRFRFSSPDLFEQAKIYGTALLNDSNEKLGKLSF